MRRKTVNGKDIVSLIEDDVVFVLGFSFSNVHCLHKKGRSFC